MVEKDNKITGIGYQLIKNDIDESTFKIMNEAKYLYIDTEAMGLNIDRDRLCLVQILSNNHNKVILIQIGKNIEPHPLLTKLLSNDKIIKVFHYAFFDMSVIQKYLKITMKNIICTRILSKITRTFTDKHGLATLCRDLLNINLLKDSQSSDWGAEDLTPQQLSYAANDVIYLRSILDILQTKAIRENRWHIAQEAFATLPNAINIELCGFHLTDLLNH